MSEPLPTAAYGSRDKVGLGRLWTSPSFPAAANKAFDQLTRGLEFKASGSPVPYPPAFALWPAGDGVLLVRIEDAGRDDHGRPHSPRVVAAWTPFRPIGEIASLLAPDAWPAEIGRDVIDFRPGTANPRIEAELRDWGVADRGWPRVIAGHHANLDVKGVDLSFAPDGTLRTIGRNPRPTSVPTARAGAQGLLKSVIWWGVRNVPVGLVIAAIFTGYYGVELIWRDLQDVRKSAEKVQKDLEDVKSSVDLVSKTNGEIKTKVEKLEELPDKVKSIHTLVDENRKSLKTLLDRPAAQPSSKESGRGLFQQLLPGNP